MSGLTCGYLVFRVGREWYGISVDSVIEVLHMVALNEVPGGDALGVMTLRDGTIKVFDLRQRLGLLNPQYTLDTPIIAVSSQQVAVGLVVDEADDVMQIVEESVTPYEDDLIKGVFRLDGRMIFVIDVERIVTVRER